jgi:hypothetical protein
MVNPIKETPVLYGEDARRFAERIENPISETPECFKNLKMLKYLKNFENLKQLKM